MYDFQKGKFARAESPASENISASFVLTNKPSMSATMVVGPKL